MNKITRRHYPIEKLPDDLRFGLSAGAHVTVTVISEEPVPPNLLLEAMDAPDRPRRAKAEIDRMMTIIRQD
jgi:hypothetical protein